MGGAPPLPLDFAPQGPEKCHFWPFFLDPRTVPKRALFGPLLDPLFGPYTDPGRRAGRLIIAPLQLRRSRARHDAQADGQGRRPRAPSGWELRSSGHPFRTERWPGVQRSRCRLWMESGWPSRASIRVAQRRRHHGIEVCRSSVLSDRRSLVIHTSTLSGLRWPRLVVSIGAIAATASSEEAPAA